MHLNWRSSVGVRFTLLAFFLVLGISLVLILFEGFYSYKRETDRLSRQLLQIEQSHLPAIVSSLWLTDYSLLQRQLEAIVRFQYIERVEVVSEEGKSFFSGVKETGQFRKESRVLEYSRRGRGIEVGTFRIYIDQEGLRRDVLRIELFSALWHLLIAFVIAFIVSVLFHRQIGRHLETIARSLQAAEFADTEEELRLKRKRDYQDEIQRLVEAINTMRQRLQSHLKERQLLMSEVHHRIKNDMSFVKSLLSLQAMQSDAPETKTALEEASNRVSVMTEIYKRLYQQESFLEVRLRPLVEQIAVDLRERGILLDGTIDLEIDDLTVSNRFSVTIGVMLNELITNAAKYAFPPGTFPYIHIGIATGDGASTLFVKVADSGRGLDKEVLSGERIGFGLTIVKALVDQHRGTLNLYNDNGAVAAIELQLSESELGGIRPSGQ
ncbi:MAG: hypothetical protein K9L68_14790 [Spirochaetales bacterium]|nr:hypothetical protein [Spirochaetales bacterium]MCF7939857.1 hypothetical protein [Spirochaetales bacterium]